MYLQHFWVFFFIIWRAKGKFSKVRKVPSRKLQFASKVYKMLKAVYLSILQRASNLHNLRPAIPERPEKVAYKAYQGFWLVLLQTKMHTIIKFMINSWKQLP